MAWLDMKDGPPRPPPIIQLGPVNQSLAVGGIAELHCQFSTGKDHTQTTIWLKEGVPLEFASSDRLDLSDGHNLQIRGD